MASGVPHQLFFSHLAGPVSAHSYHSHRLWPLSQLTSTSYPDCILDSILTWLHLRINMLRSGWIVEGDGSHRWCCIIWCCLAFAIGLVFTPSVGDLNNTGPGRGPLPVFTGSTAASRLAAATLLVWNSYYFRSRCMWIDSTIAFTLVFNVFTVCPWTPSEVVWPIGWQSVLNKSCARLHFYFWASSNCNLITKYAFRVKYLIEIFLTAILIWFIIITGTGTVFARQGELLAVHSSCNGHICWFKPAAY